MTDTDDIDADQLATDIQTTIRVLAEELSDATDDDPSPEDLPPQMQQLAAMPGLDVATMVDRFVIGPVGTEAERDPDTALLAVARLHYETGGLLAKHAPGQTARDILDAA